MLKMSDSKHFRVIVDLSAFFYDHRRVARVFVRGNLKTIKDLQNRISEVFGITEFYLTTGGHFLPISEDVRVLSNNETVCVIPNKPKEIERYSETLTQQAEKKKEKPVLELIAEDSSETFTPKKKKSKKRLDVISVSLESEDAIPHKKKKLNYSENSKSNEKKHKYNNESLNDDSGQISMSKDKNNKKKHVNTTGDSAEDEIPHKKKKLETDENAKTNKIKNKHKIENIVYKSFDANFEKEKVQENKPNQSIVEREVCNFENSQKIIDLKKKLKQKTEEYINKNSSTSSYNPTDTSSNIKNVLPKLQNHIKNCSSRWLANSSLPDTVRLSRHVDTPIKSFNKYMPPPRITDQYLSKNKVNIVKIDIVKTGNGNMAQTSTSSDNSVRVPTENIGNLNLSQSSHDSSPHKIYVKELVKSFEKNISPELKNIEEVNGMEDNVSEIKDKDASDYTNACLGQKEQTSSENLESKTDIPINNNIILMDSDPDDNVLLKELNTVEPPTMQAENEINVSMDLSSIAHDSSYVSGISRDSTLNISNMSLNVDNSSVRSRNTISNKRFQGVGTLLEQLRESDSVISHESDTSIQYITKRKRVRKHRRKNKKSDEGQNSGPVKDQLYVIKPMNVQACPSLHIKFEDNTEDSYEKYPVIVNSSKETEVESCMLSNKQNGEDEPKPEDKSIIFDEKDNNSCILETVTLSDENDDPIMENKSIFGDESISKAPLMKDKIEPKVGDVIAFKILKLTDNYTPQVSNYMVGKLEIYISENKTAYFKILRGEGELLTPTGKLTLQGDAAIEHSKYKEFLWTELMEPKLLYP